MTCTECKPWQETETTPTPHVGECRKELPALGALEAGFDYRQRGDWPKTLALDWCSQFEAIPIP